MGAKDNERIHVGASDHHATALKDFARPEPLPWSDFLATRGHALAAFGRGKRPSWPNSLT
jgi:hypothetical protein